MALASPAWSAEVDYLKDVKPTLVARCYACHAALQQKGDLRVDTVKSLLEAKVIVPGNSEASPLVAHVVGRDKFAKMPPPADGEALTTRQVELLRAWIDGGAIAPANDPPDPDPRDHWAFRAPVRPKVPENGKSHPIDAFLVAEWVKRGLVPQTPAARGLLLRRVTLDLTGLPPTPEEYEAFAKDTSPDAYEKVVERLLASSHYGERWGRHFLDVWRYSDWWGLGAEVRNSQKHMWHWRDWVIESLNADKGYDQLVREMLAADELYPTDPNKLRATGYLARQYFKFNRTTWMDETIEHTAKAFLGLTVNCAKCHDHKYDPITQADYYRLRAIFEPYQVRTDMAPGELDYEKDGIPRAFDCNLDTPTYLHVRGDERNPNKSRVIKPAVPSFLAPDGVKIASVKLPPEAHLTGLRAAVVETHLKAARERIVAARATLEVARKTLAEAEVLAKAASPNGTKPTAAKPIVRDDFAAAKPDLWDIRDGTWNYRDGRLVQSRVGFRRAALRLKQLPPSDFEARLKYIPTGGDMWKSVGIVFDGAAQTEVLAYLSAYAGGPKAQVSYKKDGKDVYPAEAAKARSVDLNKPHEITLRVRGTLVNMEVDGQLAVAYRLPIARVRGHLEVIAFDATAEFLAFELSELPPGLTLAEPGQAGGKSGPGPLNLDQAKRGVTVAEKALSTTETQLASIQARAAADRARYDQSPAENLASLITAAVRAESTAALAKADEDVVRADLDVARAVADKKAEAEKKLAAAKGAFETARKALDAPGTSYTSLTGSLKSLESNLETEASRNKAYPATSTGRRTALANWIADRNNPLTARVVVNHLWARHFGKPLVATVFDFGRKGTRPTHPELLDWLAVELTDHGWSLKRIHRLIVTSTAYRMSSTTAGAPAVDQDVDPENRYLWRQNPIRMESQAVRDSLLHLAGRLDLTLGGPPVPVSAQDTSLRRSVYFFQSHNEHHKFLSQFDDASVLECYRRTESIVPQQALALSNSQFAIATSAAITQRLNTRLGRVTDDVFVTTAFEMLLGSQPTADEKRACLDALAEWQKLLGEQKHADAAGKARANLVAALVNHNDFVTVR
ncbi:hypothetical protein FRUB_00986 [Fimbriiglobus ruber]|uniref:Cytochrome c domain-containing protein n=1 Tax=Fimbriiglobus ruber TaxID=1908690 RepID=A0A225EGD4_9BACT|nr:hypothetical protein FRUB_00986 [Fimbriiglobus ruber]